MPCQPSARAWSRNSARACERTSPRPRPIVPGLTNPIRFRSARNRGQPTGRRTSSMLREADTGRKQRRQANLLKQAGIGRPRLGLFVQFDRLSSPPGAAGPASRSHASARRSRWPAASANPTTRLPGAGRAGRRRQRHIAASNPPPGIARSSFADGNAAEHENADRQRNDIRRHDSDPRKKRVAGYAHQWNLREMLDGNVSGNQSQWQQAEPDQRKPGQLQRGAEPIASTGQLSRPATRNNLPRHASAIELVRKYAASHQRQADAVAPSYSAAASGHAVATIPTIASNNHARYPSFNRAATTVSTTANMHHAPLPCACR